ncbi:MAG: hypothetical protein AAF902_02320 [Chloroflexota bacterium]
MDSKERQLFTYTFIPNIDHYEPKMFLGLTLYEAFGVAAAFVVPLMAFQSVLGLVLAVVGTIVSFSMFKRFEGFGNLSLPVYLFKRLKNRINGESISMANLHPQIEAQVRVSDFEGRHLATYGKDE